MPIFGRDEPDAQAPSTPPPSRKPAQPKTAGGVTTISAGTQIQGEISGPTEVQIDGTLEGRVCVDSSVRVESNGRVNGEIRAKTVSVAGKVVGNIVGGDKVDIGPSGKLQGDVKAPRVSIAEGAYFKGRVEMTGEAPAAAAQPAKAQPTKPAQPANPTQSGHSAQSAQPAQSAKPAQSGKPSDPAAAAQPKLGAISSGESHK